MPAPLPDLHIRSARADYSVALPVIMQDLVLPTRFQPLP